MGVAELESVISEQCTDQFTDTWTCAWKLIYIEVYCLDITELE